MQEPAGTGSVAFSPVELDDGLLEMVPMPRPELYRPAVLVGVGALLLASPSAHAQGLFEALFGPPRVHRPAYIYNAPIPRFERVPPVEAQPERRRRAPSAAFAPPPVMPKKAKPARALPDKELVSSLMSDSTLERGDIVVFPDGPRVYRGSGGSRHKLSDFEDLRGSRLVGKGTRETVLASTRATDSTVTVVAKSKPRRTRQSREPEDVTVTGGIAVSSSDRR
jgi:hypothetical protein